MCKYNSINNINKLPVNKKYIFSLVLILLLCVSTLHAQEDRRVMIEGESFTVGTLIQEIERQAQVSILNVSPFVNRSEVIRESASPEFVRDVVDQVLAGTPFVFRDANTFTVVIVERADGVLDQVFVDRTTNRVVGINEVFGQEALGLRAQVLDQMLVDQVLSGRQYTFRSTGTYTIITIMVYHLGRYVERQIVVDVATGQVVPLERFLNPQITPQFDTFVFPTDYFPRFAIKTNLLYGATTTPNLGVEFFLNRYLTLDISAGWNPFVHRDNRKFAHWMIQPTLRYWIQEPFNGFFLGLSLMYSNFNVSGITQPYEWFGVFPRLALSGDDGYRFRGDAYSVSLQLGHQWVLSPRWAIEASVNIGYMFLDYQRWGGGWCGLLQGTDQRHYFGPTNAGISLIYIFR